MSYTESFITNVLRRKYSGDEWTFLSQVRNATGFSVREIRTADAMAFGNYPSRGLTIQGFEIKVSRQDWIKEKDNPTKAEPIAQYVDQWWIVAPVGIVRLEELPAGWGLQEVEGEKIKIAKAAPVRSDPKVPPRSFWMSVMRSFKREESNEDEIKQAVELAERSAYRKGQDETTKRLEERIRQSDEQRSTATRQIDAYRNQYNELIAATGLTYQDLLTRKPLVRALCHYLQHLDELQHSTKLTSALAEKLTLTIDEYTKRDEVQS